MADDSTQKSPTISFTGLQKVDLVAEGLSSSAVASNSKGSEDEFQSFYLGQGTSKGLVQPPFDLKLLERRIHENNALAPCIAAMVTNIDGTDFDFEKDKKGDETEAEDATVDKIWDFFLEPWPGESFVTQRKAVRADLEGIGNGYLEFIRNAQDEILFSRHVEGKTMRISQLSDPVDVNVTIKRNGRDVKIVTQIRERRFAQMLSGKTIMWFKEFGASRDLNKHTGEWAKPGQRLPYRDRASEILHFKNIPDPLTPYGVPRWEPQMPSVVGSRKAEEFNLEFFENGGVPPVMIILQGGTLQSETRQAFEQKTSGRTARLNRVQVIEVEPTGGSIEKAGTARVTVERFGAERQQDSMFEKYDEKAEMRIRKAFRLPPIFVGLAQDYSFATAYASYTVAEAQVFKPERDEFDEIMSIKVLPALGYPGYRFKSKPLSIKDVTQQLKAMELAWGTNRVEPEEFIDTMNDIAGTDLKVSAEPITPDPTTLVPAAPGASQTSQPAKAASATPNAPPAKGKPQLRVVKSEGILALAFDTAEALRKRDEASLVKNIQIMNGLTEEEGVEFQSALAMLQFLDPTRDPEGLAELAGCTIAVMHANSEGQLAKADCDCGSTH